MFAVNKTYKLLITNEHVSFLLKSDEYINKIYDGVESRTSSFVIPLFRLSLDTKSNNNSWQSLIILHSAQSA